MGRRRGARQRRDRQGKKPVNQPDSDESSCRKRLSLRSLVLWASPLSAGGCFRACCVGAELRRFEKGEKDTCLRPFPSLPPPALPRPLPRPSPSICPASTST